MKPTGVHSGYGFVVIFETKRGDMRPPWIWSKTVVHSANVHKRLQISVCNRFFICLS